jgi:two-component system phosphate regulon sensor histidine kinase PhoR
MNRLSPRRINILVAIIASVFQLFILCAGFWSVIMTQWKMIVVSSLSTFVIIYWVSNYFINNFFIRTIKPIYRIIRTVKSTTAHIAEDIEESDFTTNLEEEVDLWAKEKTKQIAQLRQMEKYRKEFIGDVSHELKTPIFTIQGYISTLIDGGIDDPNINMKYLLRTEKSIDRMISIVEDLMSINKLESGELVIKPEVFDLKLLVLDIFDMYEDRALKKRINLNFKESNLLSYNVKADKKMISQVLINLVVNSINYGKEDGKTEISIYDMDKMLMVDVADDGIGIDEKEIPRLFERFYRVDKSRSKDQGGTGLGLAICKHIIEAHGQSINVSSKIAKGSSFSFTIEKA